MADIQDVSYSKSFYVNSYETDCNQGLKLHCLFSWFSEIAWEHAKLLGVGFEELSGSDCFWVLAGIMLKIRKLPKWQDNVILRTWPSGTSGLYFTREFEVIDKNNNRIASAGSSWVIINRKTHKPTLHVKYSFLEKRCGDKLDETSFTKIRNLQNSVSVGVEIAKYADIDMHDHINNSVYIRWVENILADHNIDKISALKVQYLNEVKLGDKIELFMHKSDKSINIEAKINSGIPGFRAEIVL